MSMRVVIVGAGISGLTAAYWLKKAGVDVLVLEQGATVGGTMQTLREDGWLVETGPNSALETTPLFGEMFEGLGILDQRVYANEKSNRRYILRDGMLHPLPMSPAAFLGSRLWSAAGKLRLLKEPFVGRAEKEETIAEFVQRRLGREFLDYAINPFVAGVYAGNPEQLSVRAAFPKLYALEEKYGGLIKGMIKGAKERRQRAETAKDRARMFSFVDGMGTFPQAIARMLGDAVQTNTRVVGIERSDSSSWTVLFASQGRTDAVQAAAVIIATPAAHAAQMIARITPSLAEKLSAIYYPPVAEVFLGFRHEQIPRALDGFGFLIPAKEQRNILGTIWSSAIFPNRSPEGHAALTTFVGGSRQPEMCRLSDEDLIRIVTEELHAIMGVVGQPVFSKVLRWEKAIPQYNLGYLDIMSEVERCEAEVPGLFFCSNFRGGIAVGDCVMSGKRIADRVASLVRAGQNVASFTNVS
jgi:oxygen-dependent protoporphyrinogen oxidase